MKNENIPCGYKMENGKLVVCEEKAEIIRAAFDKCLDSPKPQEKEKTTKSTVIYTRATASDSADISFSEQIDACIDFASENEMTVIKLNPDKPSIHKLIENAQADGCDIIVIVKERN